MLLTSAKSNIGERSEQQDAIFVKHFESGEVLLVLCDGMGGFNGGSKASNMAISEIFRVICNDNLDNIPDLLTYAMDVADSAVFKLKDENNKRLGAGTTCVTVLIKNNKLYWLSVGDSRLYLIRNSAINQMTRDHVVNCRLCSYLGINGIDRYDISEKPLDLMKNDILILASDGLYRSISESDILKYSVTETDVDILTEKIINSAVDAGKGRNQDNASIILCKLI